MKAGLRTGTYLIYFFICVLYYNEVRLHSAIGYITPRDMLEGCASDVYAIRIRRLTHARDVRVAFHALEREARLGEAA